MRRRLVIVFGAILAAAVLALAGLVAWFAITVNGLKKERVAQLTAKDEVTKKFRAALPQETPTLDLPIGTRNKVWKNWLTVEQDAWQGLDFGWMAALADFGYWDLEHSSPLAASGAPTPMSPLPRKRCWRETSPLRTRRRTAWRLRSN
jgi:hypothetical protein